jgi:hypothetical protein
MCLNTALYLCDLMANLFSPVEYQLDSTQLVAII